MGNELSWLYNPDTYVPGAPLAPLAALRERHAVLRVEEAPLPSWEAGEGFWLVLRHAEVASVLRDPATFSSALGGTQLRNPATAADLAFVRRMMLNMDPPEHTRLRRLLQSSFTSRAIADLEHRIHGHVSAILDRVIDGRSEGDCDFVTDIAADLPLLALADVLGMPGEDRYLMFDWANRVIGFQDPDYATSARFDASRGSAMAREAVALRPGPDASGAMPDPRSRAGMPDLYHYAHLLAEHKRGNPGKDIMSLLLSQIDEDGSRVSIEEFENLFWLFAVAGNETLRNGIPGGMIALLQHPDAMDALRADPTLMASTVEEMLRWWTPVMIFRRTATRDCVIADTSVRAGDKVVVSFLSANRDPRVFAAPESFDIRRQANPHQSFGYGPHFCLGAQLARVQMRAMFSALLARFSTLTPTAPPTFLRSNFQRGVKTLPLHWTAAG